MNRKFFRPDADIEACSLIDIAKIKLLHKLVKLASLNQRPYVASSARIFDLITAYTAHRHGIAYDLLVRGIKMLSKNRQRLRSKLGT